MNYIDEGPLSDEFAVLAATEPDQATALTKTGSTKTSISITWTAPYNGGTSIDGYKVLIKQAD